ncbi:CAP domain-containing protein [Oceanobacillus sp. CAU 1775]
MRKIRNLLVITIIGLVGLYLWNQSEVDFQGVIQSEVIEKMNDLQSKTSPDSNFYKVPLEGDVYEWMGSTEEELIQTYGEPVRVDRSAYGYEWFVYTDHAENYIQFGVEDGEIKTIYAIGDEYAIDPIAIGQSYEQINEVFNFEDQVSYSKGLASYSFKMTTDDMKRRPLVKINDDNFLQLYFDTFTNELSSVRVLAADVLLKQRPYEISYRGTLPDPLTFSDKEWEQIEAGMEQQIFDISNVIRTRFNRSLFEWDSEVSEVAFNHSKDMNNNNYFSHYSQNGDGLKERLEVTGLFYIAAGENIAAQYPDAPSAVEGWLNSEGHREALLTEEYTHLGVGVYRYYYTQNFLAKPI